MLLWILNNCSALLLLLLLLLPEVSGYKQLTYSQVELLQLSSSALCNARPAVNLPPEIRPRKRGRRGGVRTRLRKRPFRPSLPSILLANVRSLRNKMDLLHAKCRVERAFRNVCIIALTETWLDGDVLDTEVSLDNFSILRADRTSRSGKDRGGGVCILNKRWCTNIKVHHTVCTPDMEMLTLSLRPFHLPREFPTLVISCVYIPPSANTGAAVELVAEGASHMMAKYPDAPVFILGDFNSCRLDCVMPSFHQYVDIPTRKNTTLDLCYGNISGAFIAHAHPPLGSMLSFSCHTTNQN